MAKDLVAEARAKVLAEQASAHEAAPKAEEPEELPGEEEEAEAPDTPEEPSEEPPVFSEGEHVSPKDGRSPGIIEGQPYMARCYTVTPDDGGDPYCASEESLNPYEEPEEAPMTDDTTAPEGLSKALGLSPAATLGECTIAAQAQSAALQRETGEAKSAALLSEGVHANLKSIVMGAMVREDGEAWTDTAARLKASMPEAFQAKATLPANDKSAEGSTKTDTAPKGQAPIGAKIPNTLGAATGNGPAKASADDNGKAPGRRFVAGRRQ